MKLKQDIVGNSLRDISCCFCEGCFELFTEIDVYDIIVLEDVIQHLLKLVDNLNVNGHSDMYVN